MNSIEVYVDSNMVFFVRLSGLHPSDNNIENLRRLVGSKERLIKKALESENTEIFFDGTDISFPWFKRFLSDDEVMAVKHFLIHLVITAFSLNRTAIRQKEVDNEKFTFRIFLLRLGLVGPEYKFARKLFLQRLSGSTAYRRLPNDKRNKDELK